MTIELDPERRLNAERARKIVIACIADSAVKACNLPPTEDASSEITPADQQHMDTVA